MNPRRQEAQTCGGPGEAKVRRALAVCERPEVSAMLVGVAWDDKTPPERRYRKRLPGLGGGGVAIGPFVHVGSRRQASATASG